jgi:hypothetical protein
VNGAFDSQIGLGSFRQIFELELSSRRLSADRSFVAYLGEYLLEMNFRNLEDWT